MKGLNNITSSSIIKKEFSWQFTMRAHNEKYFRCRFCNRVCTETINKMKQHLVGTWKGIKPCSKVSIAVQEKCIKSLEEITKVKAQRGSVLNDIRSSSVSASVSDSGNSSSTS